MIEFPGALGFKLKVLIQKMRAHGRTWASVQHRRYLDHDRASKRGQPLFKSRRSPLKGSAPF